LSVESEYNHQKEQDIQNEIDDLLSILSNKHRRHIIKFMTEEDRSNFEFKEIVNILSKQFEEDEKYFRLNLHHSYLPKLENYGLIENYNPGDDENTIKYSVNTEIPFDEEEITGITDNLHN